ncbi:isochorismate synthase DhbC [Paenibacillus elgii]|uniref:isochorismate synthase DhbC n=1 Tax=Paenibacillus elgii TaxID=189691 RepID=UPI000FD67889|nr:isochorismate synthase DhbC [Paenibacillus elgii]NEN86677.1 isochorismate synthase DhbC [Paenibacillus elgii]
MVNLETVPAAWASELIDMYEAGSSFFLASPQRTLLAKGEAARLSVQGGADRPKSLPQHVAELLARTQFAGGAPSVVVGAIPFDPAKPAELIVPQTARWAGKLQLNSEAADRHRQPDAEDYKLRPVPEPEVYEQSVSRALARFRKGDLRKVVLGRTLHLTLPVKVDVNRLLHNLARHNPHGYTFAVNLAPGEARAAWRPDKSNGQEPRTLIGASPELLVTRTGGRLKANPLAGSAPRSSDPVEDRRRAEALLASAKDRHEHAVVIEAVADALRPYCSRLDVPREPSLVQTSTMWHLSTVVTGELADPWASSLELALALHPTPAICGTPTDLAQETIRESEPFDRGFFTGAVGWCDASGDGEWVVTIRCAEVEGRELRLFAGAGIVEGSSPQAELAETSAKFRTLLQAMGLNQPQPAVVGGDQ